MDVRKGERLHKRLFAISCFFMETNCGSKWSGKNRWGKKGYG